MITIFTPTYNRAYILPQLYASLLRQTNKNFEWIIIDDGSTDETEELVCRWINEKKAPFEIKYFNQINSGKHCAINKGVSVATTEWFFIVDSDDYILDDAVEKIISWTKDCINDDFAGVAGTGISPDMKTIGGTVTFMSKYIDCKNNERAKYNLGGDKAEVYKTKILAKYPFPSFNGKKFLSECAVWDAMAIDGYKIRWFNEPLIVCDYLSDGLSAKVLELELNNFEGYSYTTNVRLRAYNGLEHYRLIAQYINKARHKNIGVFKIAKKINQNISIIILMYILVVIKNKVKGDKVL